MALAPLKVTLKACKSCCCNLVIQIRIFFYWSGPYPWPIYLNDNFSSNRALKFNMSACFSSWIIKYAPVYIEVSLLSSRLTVQGQSDYSHLELAGRWTPTHAEGEMVERRQLSGRWTLWNRPDGHPEPRWHLHCAGLGPGAFYFCSYRGIYLQTSENSRTWTGDYFVCLFGFLLFQCFLPLQRGNIQ